MTNLSRLQADALNNASRYLVNAPVFTGDPGIPGPTASIYQAESKVYHMGGSIPTPAFTDSVLSMPVASDTPTSSAGTLSSPRAFFSASSSTENAYNHGGRNPSFNSDINKYSFSSEVTTANTNFPALWAYSFGNMSPTHGYSLGGQSTPPTIYRSNVYKYPFATAPGFSGTADLLPSGRAYGGGNSQQSTTNGYVDGGRTPPSGSETGNVQNIAYSSDTLSSQGPTPPISWHSSAGVSSSTNGYSIGGYYPPSYRPYFMKWPFSSSSAIASLPSFITSLGYAAGAQTADNGYVMGGYTGPPFSRKNDIYKFPFASENNETDVASLTVATGFGAGASN